MIVVIQCAGSKRVNAGRMKTRDGRPVMFVAHSELAAPTDGVVFARPDDPSDAGRTWREQLVAYNAAPGNNPLGLLSASELYGNDIYRSLVRRFGEDNTYILSAGWGLIPATFLTPAYDITFSMQADRHLRRGRRDVFADLAMIPRDAAGPIVCFASKEYVPLFAALTEGVRGERDVFYNSATAPTVAGCRLVKFDTRTRTNWQYECAKAFMDGKMPDMLPGPQHPMQL